MINTNNENNARSDDPPDNRRSAIPGSPSVKLATEGSVKTRHQASTAAKCNINMDGKLTTRQIHRFGSWNVRGVLQEGKFCIIEKEMMSQKLTILGLAETHLKGSGHFSIENSEVYFSGHETESRRGVAIIIPKKINKCVMGYNAVNDRIMSIKVNCRPLPLNIVVQVYAPTAQSTEEVIDSFYATLEEIIRAIPRRELLIVQGDWNAKVGDTRGDDHIRKVVGMYGLGERNERGERFLEFCIANRLTITNTCFKHHKRRLYTWKSPGDRTRNQIDFITIDQRWRTSIRNAKTLPSADCGSDHQLLIAHLRISLKAPKKLETRPARLKLQEIELFQRTTESAFTSHNDDVINNPELLWTNFKEEMIGSINCIVKCRKPLPKKKTWITDVTWKAIEERKELKSKSLNTSTDRREYSDLSRTIQQLCRRDKDSNLNNICAEVEQHAEKYQTADLFKKVKLITRQFKARSWTVEDKNGRVINEIDQVAERWKEYCAELYCADNVSTDRQNSNFDEEVVDLEPDILPAEIVAAVHKLKLNKAIGADNISAETLKALGTVGLQKLLYLCNAIWSTTKWPKDWTHSDILPIHKKGSTKKCDNYRTIAIISHTSKVLLHIINNRLRHYLDWQIPQVQAGFVKGKGTREQVLNMRLLVEKCYEYNVPAVMCFVDYQKAFDCVSWKHLWHVLRNMGIPLHLVKLIRNLYEESHATVRIGETSSSEFKFEKGVRQGCIISPILFNIYGEYIMRKALDDWEGGINVGGVKLSNLRYADDTTLLASSTHEMVNLLQRVETASLEMGLKINQAKTKIMIVDRANIVPTSRDLDQYEIVNQFIYLGSCLSNKGGCEQEIKRRIGMAKSAMTQLDKIWRDRSIRKNTKVYIVNTLVLPIFLYGAESWTLKATDRRRIDAFEMWCWRRMLRIPWTARRTNVSILKELNISQRLSTSCLQRVLQYFGHIARKPPDNLEKLMIMGKVDGKRARGRSPKRWSDQVSEQLDTKITDAFQCAIDRHKWRKIIKAKLGRAHHDAQN